MRSGSRVGTTCALAFVGLLVLLERGEACFTRELSTLWSAVLWFTLLMASAGLVYDALCVRGAHARRWPDLAAALGCGVALLSCASVPARCRLQLADELWLAFLLGLAAATVLGGWVGRLRARRVLA